MKTGDVDDDRNTRLVRVHAEVLAKAQVSLMNFQIPDEALNQLDALLEREGGVQWEVGDFLMDYWEEMLKYLKPNEIKDAHAKLIRDFARGSRADKTTLRDRKKMSLFFPKSVRDRFSMFSYHQFRALRSAGAEDWEKYAEIAADEGWSVAKIRRKIDEDKQPEQGYMRILTRMEKDAFRLLEDKHTPDKIRAGVDLILCVILDTKELANE